jgi:hypothetical protein
VGPLGSEGRRSWPDIELTVSATLQSFERMAVATTTDRYLGYR